MTDSTKSHVTLLVDRSGSMSAHRDDAEGAVNNYIKELKKEPSPCTLLLIDYDAPGGDMIGGSPWFHVIHNGDLKTAPVYHLQPRGNTALFDAMGQAITMTGDMLSGLPEAERPGHVFFVVQTDGQENQSKDWRIDKLIEAIKDHEGTWKWTFIFLGTGPDAFSQAQRFVGTQMAGHNTVRMADSGASYMASYAATGQNTNSARRGKTVAYGASVDTEGTVIPDEPEP